MIESSVRGVMRFEWMKYAAPTELGGFSAAIGMRLRRSQNSKRQINKKSTKFSNVNEAYPQRGLIIIESVKWNDWELRRSGMSCDSPMELKYMSSFAIAYELQPDKSG